MVIVMVIVMMMVIVIVMMMVIVMVIVMVRVRVMVVECLTDEVTVGFGESHHLRIFDRCNTPISQPIGLDWIGLCKSEVEISESDRRIVVPSIPRQHVKILRILTVQSRTNAIQRTQSPHAFQLSKALSSRFPLS
jgi:hypothetical protein